jgi:putative flippase GtrA
MQLLPVIKFGLVGCTGIAIDFSITWLMKEKMKWNKYVASSAGFCAAVVNNYLLNKYFTFHDVIANLAPQFLKFAAVSLVGLAVSNFLLWLLQKNTALNFYLSKVLVIAVVFLWNYSANAFFTFK